MRVGKLLVCSNGDMHKHSDSGGVEASREVSLWAVAGIIVVDLSQRSISQKHAVESKNDLMMYGISLEGP